METDNLYYSNTAKGALRYAASSSKYKLGELGLDETFEDSVEKYEENVKTSGWYSSSNSSDSTNESAEKV